MPTNSKPKKQGTAKSQKVTKPFVKSFTQRQRIFWKEYFSKNPHRTLRLTKRRDYVRPLALPNPFQFILFVSTTLWSNRRIFLPLMAVYALLYVGLVGITSQDTYSQIVSSIEESGSDVFSESGSSIEQAGLTLLSIVSGNANGTITESQQIFGGLLGLLAWLTTIWLLRNLLAGNKVRMRDGLYNAGAPLIASAIVFLIIFVQLLPVALAAIGYAAATNSGLIAGGGVEAMLFWIVVSLLGLLSLYWIGGSVFALVIVTLPGMYPLEAINAARELVLSRRLKLLVRLLWMSIFIMALWIITLVPIIMFDGWLKWAAPVVEWLPLVPVSILIVSTVSVFWAATYVYLLYRKVVDESE